MQLSFLKYIFILAQKLSGLMPFAIWISTKYFMRRYRFALAIKDENAKKEELGRLGALRQKFHPPGEFFLAKVKVGNNVFLKANLCQQYCGDIYYGLGFEQSEISLVEKFVPKNGIFFDVGANVGVYTLMASKLVGKGGSVHAFEPLLDVYETLRENIEENKIKNVKINQTAVGEEDGETKIFINVQNALSSLGNTKRGEIVQSQPVSAVSLDSYTKSVGVRNIDFLKIDVEGFEGHVLRGAENIIDASPNVIVMSELAEKNFAPLGFSVGAVISWMRARGFDAWMIGSQQTLRLYLVDANTREYLFQNFLFIRPHNPQYALALGYAVEN